MKNGFVSNIKEHWQILATALVAWSLFDLYNFYKPFGIEIVSYLSIGETVLLVFPSLLTGIITIIFIFAFIVFLVDKKHNEHNVAKKSDGFLDFSFAISLLKEHYRPITLKNLANLLLGVVTLAINISIVLLLLGIAYGLLNFLLQNK